MPNTAPPDIAHALNLKPEEAIKYFESKGLQLTESWNELMDGQHTRVHTVAHLGKLDVLQRVYAELRNALHEGITEAEFDRRLTPALQAAGWWGKAIDAETGEITQAYPGSNRAVQYGSPARLDLIYRQNLQTAYMAGRYQGLSEGRHSHPYWQYVAVKDSRTRPSHAALNGRIFRREDPAFDSLYPPNGWNSLLPNQRVSANSHLGLKAWYSGPAVEIIGNSGGRMTVTAQHPILTDCGWIMAKDIHKGVNLLCYGNNVSDSAVPTNLHENNPPPTIQEVFDSFGLSTATSIPRAALNLYGDIDFIAGDVEIVGADRKLMDDINASATKFVEQLKLHHATQASSLRLSNSPTNQINRDFPCGIACNDSPLPNHLPAILPITHGLSIHYDPISSQIFGNILGALPELCSNSLNRKTRLVELYDSFREGFSSTRASTPSGLQSTKPSSLASGPYGNAPICNVFVGGYGTNANAHGDIINAHPGKIKSDHVVDVRFFNYSGHVYDLQTVSGNILAYSGNSLYYIVSNCRCRTRPLTASRLQREGLAVESSDGKLVEATVPAGRYPDGSPKKADVTGIRTGTFDADGKEIVLFPDAGWSYNPGTSWQMAQRQQLIAKQAELGNAGITLPDTLTALTDQLRRALGEPLTAAMIANPKLSLDNIRISDMHGIDPDLLADTAAVQRAESYIRAIAGRHIFKAIAAGNLRGNAALQHEIAETQWLHDHRRDFLSQAGAASILDDYLEAAGSGIPEGVIDYHLHALKAEVQYAHTKLRQAGFRDLDDGTVAKALYGHIGGELLTRTVRELQIIGIIWPEKPVPTAVQEAVTQSWKNR